VLTKVRDTHYLEWGLKKFLLARLGRFIIFTDYDAYFYGGLCIEIHKLKAGPAGIGVTHARTYTDLQVFFLLVDDEMVQLAVTRKHALGLDHKAAATQLPQHAGCFAFGIKHQNLFGRRDINPLELTAFFRSVIANLMSHFEKSPTRADFSAETHSVKICFCMKITHPQTLLIDADDTLWENNVYFEKAIADFLSFLNHREMTHEQVREVLNEVERQTILQHGYGLHSFAHSLVTTFERLSLEPVTPELHQTIWKFAHRISEYPMEIIEGVADTLHYLQQREHHLILVTKGNITEQTGKIERSGLRDYFAAVEIVVEKNPLAYRDVVSKYALGEERTWMIGNSPKSDINSALAAGINAVFVPHSMTWVLEHETLDSVPDGLCLLQVEKFADLQKHF
jgi:putative hydrolase of the HAD superfamily